MNQRRNAEKMEFGVKTEIQKDVKPKFEPKNEVHQGLAELQTLKNEFKNEMNEDLQRGIELSHQMEWPLWPVKDEIHQDVKPN